MYTAVENQVTEDVDLEIKIIPTLDCHIVQITSPYVRGTLIIHSIAEQEDIEDLGGLIYKAIYETDIAFSTKELPI